MSLPGSDELTPAAIARLANVGRAAVSNWRRRYPDFPQPVGGSEVRPTFSRSEVEAWLVSTGKADQLATAGSTETGTRANGGVHLGLSVADLTAGQLLAKVMVSLLPRPTADVSPADAHTIPVDAADLPAIVDPACADGTLLTAVGDRFGDRVRLAGQEGSERAAALAASRLRGHPHDPTYEIHVGDSPRDNRLHDYMGAAAAVVCRPPSHQAEWPPAPAAGDAPWEFGIPGPRDGELAWVQHCSALLRPHGVAVVAVSARTCVQPSGRHIRAALVRSGALRDVIALPKGMGTPLGSDVYLWVLQRPLGAPSRTTTVRMTDLSGVPDAADVPREYATWQRLFSDGDSAICRVVTRTDLADGEADLLPSHYVASRADATAEDLVRVTERLRALYAHLGRRLPSFGASQTQSKLESVTLGELERSGALTILSREATPRKGDLILRTMGRPPVVATGTDSDDVGIAQVVELDAGQLDEHFVATFLWADAASRPVANMVGALSRDDLRRCRIPRMPVAEQRRYGVAFRRLRELEDALTALAKLSANVVDETVRGLTAGVLAPDMLIPNNNGAPTRR